MEGSGTGKANPKNEGANTPLGKYAIDQINLSKRSAIRIHGGRQEKEKGNIYNPIVPPELKPTEGCIRIFEADAIAFYDWWQEFKKSNPNVKPGCVYVID